MLLLLPLLGNCAIIIITVISIIIIFIKINVNICIGTVSISGLDTIISIAQIQRSYANK